MGSRADLLALKLAIIPVLIALALNGTRFVSSGADVPQYPFKDVSVGVEIWSPVENGSYLGPMVTLNVSVQFSLFAYESDLGEIEIPYQDVDYIYSLDNGEWKTIPLYSARNVECPSANPGRYYEQVYCRYVVVLQNLSEGWHSIRVNEEPDLVSYSASSSRSASLVHFKIVNTAGLSVFSPQNRTYPSDEVPLIFRVNESATSIVYSLDNGANVAFQGDTNLTGLTGGMHNLVVYAKDSSGTTISSESVIFSIAIPQRSETASPLALVFVIAGITLVFVGLVVYFKKHKR